MSASVRPSDHPLDPASTRTLRDRFQGTLVGPWDRGYDDARQVVNRMFDRRPALIARAATVDDVVRTIAFARERERPLAVRSGGHSNAGHGSADGAIVLDLADMNRLELDAKRRLAWAQPGLTTGDYTQRAHAFGLGTSFGDTPSVGIAGLTLCGGVGYLVRKHGLTIDSLVSAEMVTADGRRIQASETENADLFWALRGGGGNFGVLTALRFRLHPVDRVFAGWLVLPANRTVLSGCAALAADAPDELTTIANVLRMPRLPFVPADVHGQLVLILTAVYAGDPGAGERACAGFRGLARPLFDGLRLMPYPQIYQYSRTEGLGPHGTTMRTAFLSGLSPEVIDATLEFAARPSSPSAAIQVRVLGGAVARVPSTATAYAFREKPILFSTFVEFDAGADPAPHVAWVERFWAAVRPVGSGAYVGFLQDDSAAAVRQAYPAPTYRRLVDIKRRFDPDNLFRFNANIAPGDGAGPG